MIATFENTVNILVKAYFAGTLERLNCHACAVGNILASIKGFNYKRGLYGLVWDTEEVRPDWFNGVSCGSPSPDSFGFEKAKEQCEETGYSIEQVALIETVFENPEYRTGDEMFDRLMAVVDVLAEIHGINLEEKESAKKLFEKVIL